MKKTELILSAIIIGSIALNLYDVAGGAMLTTVFILALASFYLVFSFALFNDIKFRNIFRKSAYQNSSWKRIVFAIITGYALCTLLIGILFQIQYWPGSEMMLKFGILQSIPVLAFALIRYIPTKSVFCSGIMRRFSIPLLIGIFLVIMPASFMIDIKFRDRQEELQFIKEKQQVHP